MLEPRPQNPTLIRAYRIVALITVALVFLQAVLAGQYWYNDPDAIDIHGFVANIISLVAVMQLVLAVAAGFTPALRMRLWTALLVALVIAQTGLGYAGRDNNDLAAVHVPMGLLVFGVAMLATLLSFLEQIEERAAPYERPGGNGSGRT